VQNNVVTIAKEGVMAIDIKINQHDDYLEFVVTGSYDLNDAVNKFPHILDVCRLTGLQKVLIDYRELDREGGGTEKSLYAFGTVDQYQKYLKLGGPELQFAYLGPVVTSYEPGLEIAQQSKLSVKLFDNYSDALEWLDVKST
jgi:hypothetical protein